MIRGPLSNPHYKAQFSGHETFPLRQLWLRKAFDQVSKFPEGAPRGLFSDAEAIVTFGVGKNMVASIRHWALACGIIRDNGSTYETTTLGKFIFDSLEGVDPCLESPATIWLLHWMIAGHTPPARTTTWFYAFHNFTAQTFDRTLLSTTLQDVSKEQTLWPKASANTIKRSVECFIRSYVPQTEGTGVDDKMEAVFVELGLMQPLGGKSFGFRRGPQPNLPDGVLLFALHEFWQSFAPKQNTLAVESILFEPGSPGRAFKFDEHSLIDRLARIDEGSNGCFRWSESAGVRTVARPNDSVDEWSLLQLAYSPTPQQKAA